MAVFGKLDDIINMSILEDRILDGLLYLKEANHMNIFSTVEAEGNRIIEIDGKKLFAVYSIYNTSKGESAKFERHKKHIDIQYLLEGEELILVAFDDMKNPTDFSAENDCQLAENSSFSSIHMKQGYSSILFPEDWHAPGRQHKQTNKVKKIVVKVALDKN